MLIISLTILGMFLVIGYSLAPTFWYKLKKWTSKTNIEEKNIYLTFDDGPDKRFTIELLDLLKQYKINATFFVVARFAEYNPEIIQRMKQEGHLIGFHSLEHRNALWQTPKYTKYDFNQSMVIFNKLGIKVQFFRPPWGHFNVQTLACVKQYSLRTALWNVMAEDWRGQTTWQEIAHKLIRRTKRGHIICLHDGRGTNDAPGRMIDALEEILPIWISEGYQFVRLDNKYE